MHVCVYVCMYYVCMYVRMYVCIYERMYVYMYVCTRVYVLIYVSIYVCMHVCMYVYMYACTYICMYVCMCIYVQFISILTPYRPRQLCRTECYIPRSFGYPASDTTNAVRMWGQLSRSSDCKGWQHHDLCNLGTGKCSARCASPSSCKLAALTYCIAGSSGPRPVWTWLRIEQNGVTLLGVEL